MASSSKPRVFFKPPTTQNAVVSSSPITPSPQDVHLSTASHLTVDDVIRRRSHNLKQLASVYTDHYWKLMEDLRSKHRDYVWDYGITPFHNNNNTEEEENNNNNEVNYGGTTACAFIGCRLKAMALAKFCKLHILSDERQVLYKPCQFVVKSASAGDITCGKPIMRSIVPAHCDTHKQKAQMHLNRALKKSGLPNISCTDVVTPKFHVLVTEFVREIQRKRRAVSRENTKREIVKIESDK